MEASVEEAGDGAPSVPEEPELAARLLRACVQQDEVALCTQLLESLAHVECVERASRRRPLHVACESGWAAGVRVLLEVGRAQPDSLGDRGKAPLHYSVVNGHLPCTELLLSHGADVNAHAASSMTPLHLACMRGDSEHVRVLLTAGALPNARAASGTAPLHLACAGGFPGIVAQLLAGGASVSAFNKKLQTPLHVAVDHFRAGCAQKLLEAGADWHCADCDGRSPLQMRSEFLEPILRVVEELLEERRFVCVLFGVYIDRASRLRQPSFGRHVYFDRHVLGIIFSFTDGKSHHFQKRRPSVQGVNPSDGEYRENAQSVAAAADAVAKAAAAHLATPVAEGDEEDVDGDERNGTSAANATANANATTAGHNADGKTDDARASAGDIDEDEAEDDVDDDQNNMIVTDADANDYDGADGDGDDDANTDDDENDDDDDADQVEGAD